MIILAHVVVKKYSKPGEHDICPSCNWEDDPFHSKNPDRRGGAN
ncbi:CPCC family cysteine-rich protein [Rahnella perminowiae]